MGTETYYDNTKGRMVTRETKSASEITKGSMAAGNADANLGAVAQGMEKKPVRPKPKLNDPGISGDSVKLAKAVVQWRSENEAEDEAQKKALGGMK